MKEKIEILLVPLLDQNGSTVNQLKRLARPLGLDFGWHYLLDLTWIIQHLGDVRAARTASTSAGPAR